MPSTYLQPELVEFIPERLEEGRLYFSKRFRTASHLCCCGCGMEVITPLNPAKWKLEEHSDGSVSLFPSIGNWSLPCKSHYFITRNNIQKAGSFSLERIAAIQRRDQLDVKMLAGNSYPTWIKPIIIVFKSWRVFVRSITKFWRG